MSFYSGEVDKFQVGDLTVKIEVDQDPPHPRTEYDNLGTMVAFHRRYNLGDETDYKADHYESWEELKEAIEKNEDPAVILPLFLHDHSGLTMRTSDFGDRWDSGQVGFIFLSKKRAKEEYKKLTAKNLANAKKVLEGEVETYSDYLGGGVYGFVIEDENEEELDALWGMYGLSYAKEEAKRTAEEILKSRGEKRPKGSSMKGSGGYHVMTYGGGRYTAIAWYPSRGEADRHVQQIRDSGGWRGMPPKVEPSSR